MVLPLDPVIHQQARLLLMGVLYRNKQVSFTELRAASGLTPGNMASHLAKLEEAGYVKSGRVLVDLSLELHYKITDQGAAAFRAYLAALRALLEELEEAASAPPPVEPDAPSG